MASYSFLSNPFGFPWVGVETREVDADYAAFLEEQLPVVEATKIEGRVLDHVLEKEPCDQGLILEFGVCTGRSVNLIAKAFPDKKVFGFDSFEGFPTDWEFIKKEDSQRLFTCEHPEVEDNVTLVDGWFDATIPTFLEQHPGTCSLIHIDCDVYESTKTIFDLLEDRIVSGTILVFDELLGLGSLSGMHELKALYEFLSRTGREFEWIAYGYDQGMVFLDSGTPLDEANQLLRDTQKQYGLYPGLLVAGAMRIK